MAAAASFSWKRTILTDSQTPKTYIYTRFRGNSEKKVEKKLVAILIIGGKLKL